MTLLERVGGRACVARAWEGKACVCIGGGPSLTLDDLRAIEAARRADAVRVIAINDQYLVAPWADVGYFADARWWHGQAKGLDRRWSFARFTPAEVVAAHGAFRGQWCSIEHRDAIRDDAVFVLGADGPGGLSLDPRGLRTGKNSGYQALNLAVLAGANPVLLVAYDMRYHGRRTHSHNGHAQRVHESFYNNCAEYFAALPAPLAEIGVRVVNCTPDSRIRAFPHQPLAEALAACAPGA